MPETRLSASRPRAVVVLIAALLAWTSITTVASAAAEKSFSASLNPSSLVAGASYGASPRTPIILTILNTSNQARLGSANVTLPAGVLPTGASVVPGTATAVGQVIELRNLDLQPGTSAVVAVSAQVECAANHASYVWAFQVKQANDFNGTPGNNLLGTNPASPVSGNCQLTFSKQPAHSEKTPTIITSKIYDPAGNVVTVSVVDGEGVGVQTVSWWSGTISLAKGNDPTTGDVAALTGGLSAAAVGGSATFTPRIDVSATGYTVIASATPGDDASQGTSTSLASQPFNIVDDATICAASTGCEAVAGVGQKTQANVRASSNGAAGDLVILSINDPAVSIDCAGYAETSDIVVFNVTDSGGINPAPRSKVTTLTLAAAFVTRSASKYQVCYNDGSGALLLPICSNRSPVPPCVVSRALDRSKNLVIVVSSPPGDPGLKF